MHGKKAIIKSPSCPPPEFIKNARLIIISLYNFCENVYDIICLAEIVLNVVIFRRNTEFYKLIFESAALLEKAMHTIYMYAHVVINHSFTLFANSVYPPSRKSCCNSCT